MSAITWAAAKPQAALTALTDDRLSECLLPADIKPHAVIPLCWKPVWTGWTKHTLDYLLNWLQVSCCSIRNIVTLQYVHAEHQTALTTWYNTVLRVNIIVIEIQLSHLMSSYLSLPFLHLCLVFFLCPLSLITLLYVLHFMFISHFAVGPAAVSLHCSMMGLDSNSFFSLYRFTATDQLSLCFIGSYQPHPLQQDGLTFSRNVFKRSYIQESQYTVMTSMCENPGWDINSPCGDSAILILIMEFWVVGLCRRLQKTSEACSAYFIWTLWFLKMQLVENQTV